MLKFFCCLCTVVFSFALLSAQNSPDCRSAIPVCADAPITGIADGGVAPEAEEQGADPFGPGLAVNQPGLGVIPQGPQPGALDEPARELS